MKAIRKVGTKKEQKEVKFKPSLASMIPPIIESIGLSSEIECSDVTWWAHVAAASFAVTSLLQAVSMCLASSSERLFECFSVLSFCVMGMLKLYSLRMHRVHWLYLITLMKRLDNKHTDPKEQPHEEYESDNDSLDLGTYVKKYTAQFESTSSSLNRVYKSTLLGFTMLPFIEYVYVRVTAGSSSYPHVLPCWSPLEQVHIAGYIVLILSELVAAFYCLWVHLAFDCISAGLMIFAKGQFLLLGRYCENIAGKGRECNVTKRRDARAMHRIKYSHQTSVILFEFVDKLGWLLKDTMGIYYFIVTLTLCTVTLRLNTEVLSTTQMASLLQYLGATLTQLYLFCYYGDAVHTASSNAMARSAAYWCVSPRVRRCLVLLSVGTVRPRRLRAGPFHQLDLPSFTMIVRAAYSYYAVLRK